MLEVRDGSCDGPMLACDNNGGTGADSLLAVSLAAGQQVIVIIDGTNLSQGGYLLHVQ